MDRIRVHDKEFVPYLSEQTIQERIAELATQISTDFKDREVLFLGIY